MKIKKITAILLCMATAISMTACGTSSSETAESTASVETEAETEETESVETAKSDENAAEEEVNDPLGNEELVTINLGLGLEAGIDFDGDDTVEDNRYLDLIRENLGVDVKYDWVCADTDYDQKISLCISSNTLPDAMSVNQTQYLSMLKYGQIQSITDAFEEYASDQLKRYVSSGGDALMEAISKDGEMYAIPVPNLTANGVNEMWIRQDWLDELGLEVPQTVDQLFEAAQAFVDNGMGGEKTIGIMGPSSRDHLIAVGQNLWGLDPVFGAYNAYPKYWIKDDSGEVLYGSVQPEVREALEKLAEMYAAGVIDPEILVRSDSSEAVNAGQVGVFFGPWWSGYSISDMLKKASGDWQAYLAPLAADGKFYSPMGDPTSTYVCVRDGYEHPEAVIKIINYLIENEQKWNVDGFSAGIYPLYNVFDNADEIEYSYEWLKKFNLGEVAKEDVDITGRKLLAGDLDAIEVLKLEPKDDFSIEYWDIENELADRNLARLVSIMVGERPLVEDGYVPVENIFSGQTETMTAKWANLEKMEDEIFAKIILGQATLDDFDDFVEKWYAEGGQEILDEIADVVGD